MSTMRATPAEAQELERLRAQLDTRLEEHHRSPDDPVRATRYRLVKDELESHVGRMRKRGVHI